MTDARDLSVQEAIVCASVLSSAESVTLSHRFTNKTSFKFLSERKIICERGKCGGAASLQESSGISSSTTARHTPPLSGGTIKEPMESLKRKRSLTERKEGSEGNPIPKDPIDPTNAVAPLLHAPSHQTRKKKRRKKRKKDKNTPLENTTTIPSTLVAATKDKDSVSKLETQGACGLFFEQLCHGLVLSTL